MPIAPNAFQAMDEGGVRIGNNHYDLDERSLLYEVFDGTLIAHAPLASQLLQSIKSMGRNPVAFKCRLILELARKKSRN